MSSSLKTIQDVFNELFEPNDFKISTWMAMGGVFVVTCQAYLPNSWGSWLPVLYLGYRMIKMFLDTLYLHTGSYTTLKRGRWFASLPEPKAPVKFNGGADGLVMFVLGARINQYT